MSEPTLQSIADTLSKVVTAVEGLRQGQEELRVGQKETANAIVELRQGQQEFRQGQDDLYKGQESLRQGQDGLYKGQESLRQGQESLDRRQESFSQGQASLRQGQDALRLELRETTAKMDTLQEAFHGLATHVDEQVAASEGRLRKEIAASEYRMRDFVDRKVDGVETKLVGELRKTDAKVDRLVGVLEREHALSASQAQKVLFG